MRTACLPASSTHASGRGPPGFTQGLPLARMKNAHTHTSLDARLWSRAPWFHPGAAPGQDEEHTHTPPSTHASGPGPPGFTRGLPPARMKNTHTHTSLHARLWSGAPRFHPGAAPGQDEERTHTHTPPSTHASGPGPPGFTQGLPLARMKNAHCLPAYQLLLTLNLLRRCSP